MKHTNVEYPQFMIKWSSCLKAQLTGLRDKSLLISAHISATRNQLLKTQLTPTGMYLDSNKLQEI